jgi:hypothetical protein
MQETKKLTKTLPKKLKNILVELWIDLVELNNDWTTWNYLAFTNAILN